MKLNEGSFLSRAQGRIWGKKGYKGRLLEHLPPSDARKRKDTALKGRISTRRVLRRKSKEKTASETKRSEDQQSTRRASAGSTERLGGETGVARTGAGGRAIAQRESH